MYLWTKNCLEMGVKLKAYGRFGGFLQEHTGTYTGKNS